MLNSDGKVPTLTWQKEQAALLMKLKELKGEHEWLKSEVAAVDRIRNKVYDILRRERQREQPQKLWGMER